MKFQISKWGYQLVCLTKERKKTTAYVHQLVLLAFRGPRPPNLETMHLDGDKTNNYLENLAYGTKSQNMKDRWRHRPRTHCIHGHLYDEENTGFQKTGRRCRACGREKTRKRRERLRGSPDLKSPSSLP